MSLTLFLFKLFHHHLLKFPLCQNRKTIKKLRLTLGYNDIPFFQTLRHNNFVIRQNVSKFNVRLYSPVVYGADSDSVFRMLNNRAVQTNIELGDILPDNKVIVTKGLKKGDVIISEGQTKLFNGFPVLTEREFQQMMMKKFEEKEGKAHK